MPTTTNENDLEIAVYNPVEREIQCVAASEAFTIAHTPTSSRTGTDDCVSGTILASGYSVLTLMPITGQSDVDAATDGITGCIRDVLRCWFWKVTCSCCPLNMGEAGRVLTCHRLS